MVRTLVITALGRESFTGRQLERLDRLGSVEIVGRVEELDDAEFVRLARPYDVVALTRRPRRYLGRDVLSRLPRLRTVVVHTTGVHWIDADHLAERNIDLLSLGGYATESVAEHTLAGILMLSRRTHLSMDRARNLVPAAVSLRGLGELSACVGIARRWRRDHREIRQKDDLGSQGQHHRVAQTGYRARRGRHLRCGDPRWPDLFPACGESV